MEERLKLPKNVRQIGEREECFRIYMEDYVNTYLERCLSRQGELTTGVLVGEACVIEGNACLFVTGAMEVNHVWAEDGQLLFSEYSWERMLEAKTRYFQNGELCGIFISGNEEILPDQEIRQKFQNRYFPETGSVLFAYSNADSVFWYQNAQALSAMKGYYIFYERNESMQNFLVESSQGRQVDRDHEEVVVSQFREKMEEKKPEKKTGGLRAAYGLCACLALAVAILAINSMGSSAKISEMEKKIGNAMSKEGTDQVAATLQETVSDGGTLVIYDVPGMEITSSQETVNVGQTLESITETEAAVSEPLESSTESEAAAEMAESSTESEAAAEMAESSTESEAAAETLESITETEAAAEIPESSTESEAAVLRPESSSAAEDVLSGEMVTLEDGSSKTVMAQPMNQPCMVYKVGSGDTLSIICRKIYGNCDRLREICTINELTDPNVIENEQELLLPFPGEP